MKFYKHLLASDSPEVSNNYVSYISEKLKSCLNREYHVNNITYIQKYMSDNDKAVCIFLYGPNNPKGCYESESKEIKFDTLNGKTHLLKQCIFIIKDNYIYISDTEKENLLFNYIKTYDNSFSLKIMPEIDTIEEFISRCNKVSKIKAKGTNNLFIEEFINKAWFENAEVDSNFIRDFSVEMGFDEILPVKSLKKIYTKLVKETHFTEFKIDGEKNNEFISISKNALLVRENFDIDKNEDTGYYEIEDVYKKIKI